VRNEPNLGRPEGKCAKRTQFWCREPQDCGLAIADCGLKEGTLPECDCAKRSQFGPRARKWARARGAAVPGRRVIVQNEANFSRPGAVAGGEMCKTNPISPSAGRSRAGRPRGGTACRGNPRAGRGQALPRGEARQTKPICRRGRADEGPTAARQRGERGRAGRKDQPWWCRERTGRRAACGCCGWLSVLPPGSFGRAPQA
jgi:hypothetical protein